MGARTGAPTGFALSTRCISGTRWCPASASRPRRAVATATAPLGGWKCRRVTTFSPLTSEGREVRVQVGGPTQESRVKCAFQASLPP